MRAAPILVIALASCSLERGVVARRCAHDDCGAPVASRPTAEECRAVFNGVEWHNPETDGNLARSLCEHADRSALECRREVAERDGVPPEYATHGGHLSNCVTQKWYRAALAQGFDDVVLSLWRASRLRRRPDTGFHLVPTAFTGIDGDVLVNAFQYAPDLSMRLYSFDRGYCGEDQELIACTDAPLPPSALHPPTPEERERAMSSARLRDDAEAGSLRWVMIPRAAVNEMCPPDPKAARPSPDAVPFLVHDRLDARCAYVTRAPRIAPR